MQGLLRELPLLLELSIAHIIQSIVPLILAVLIAVPLAQLVRNNKIARATVLTVSSFLFTIPSLTLFIVLPLILGTTIIDPLNVIIALSIYAVSLLVRASLDAFDSIDDSVRQAAVALGYTKMRRFFAVDLPLALPVLFSGLRVVSVTNISLVTVAIVIGVRNYGYLFTSGMQRNNISFIIAGIVLTMILALVVDAILVLILRLLTPWTRAGKITGKNSGPTAGNDAQSAAKTVSQPRTAEAEVN